jgi:hypothetical protein
MRTHLATLLTLARGVRTPANTWGPVRKTRFSWGGSPEPRRAPAPGGVYSPPHMEMPTRASAAGQGSRPTKLSDIAHQCVRHIALLAAVAFFSASARATTIAPNPGGPVVITNSTTATIGYIDTPVTQRVDLFSTTLLAFLNTNQVFSQTFALPFSDPTVQAAVAQADAILSGGGASFGSPMLFSNMSALQSSVTATPPTSTCLIESSIPLNPHATGATTVTTTNTFGPAVVMVGQCQSDIFNVLSGQLDINVNTDFVYAVPRNIVTTNTFLTTQTYRITGTTAGASVPEPATAGLVLLGLGAVAWWRRRRFRERNMRSHERQSTLRPVGQTIGLCRLPASREGWQTTKGDGLPHKPILRHVALLLAAFFCASARATTIAPNPGGPVVVTNSTSATITYVDTSVTQRVDLYSTTLLALLNTNQVFSQTFALPFSDPAVQAAVAQADAILSGGGAIFGAPLLISNMSALQSSVTAPPPTSTCLIEGSIPANPHVTGATTVTVTNTFGPASIMVGDCKSDIFNILSGQLDININTDIVYAIPRNIVTTNTFLTTQTYRITGTTAGASVPEPATAGLVLFGLGAMAWWRWRFPERKTRPHEWGRCTQECVRHIAPP